MPDPRAPSMPSVKGVAFRSVMTVFERHRSREAAEAALDAMPTEVREAYRYGTIIAAGWYPIAWYRALWAGLRASTGEGEELVRFLGRASIDHDFNTIYKAMFRMLTPRTLVSIGLKHFGQIYDTGRVEVVDSRPSSVKIVWAGCAGFDRNMWIEVLGSCERLAELAGGKSGRASFVEGGGDSDGHCTAMVHWR